MVKPNEVRVGNLLEAHLTGEIVSVDWLAIKHLADGNYQSFYAPTVYKPIVLTEEWLEKFGFEKKEKYGWKGNGHDWQPETSKTECQDFIGNETTLFLRYTTFSWRKSVADEWEQSTELSVHKGQWYEKADYEISCMELKYVHQLQNIFYCLTGEELELKQLV